MFSRLSALWRGSGNDPAPRGSKDSSHATTDHVSRSHKSAISLPAAPPVQDRSSAEHSRASPVGVSQLEQGPIFGPAGPNCGLCFQPMDEQWLQCSQCVWQFHRSCVPSGDRPPRGSQWVVCSRCRGLGKEIGFRRPAGIFHSDPRVENLARRSYHSHNSISRASLAQLLMGVSKCVRPAKNTKKHELVRRLVFIEFGVNFSIAPAAGGRLTAFHDIPADGTVARWLWDELEGMAMRFPAAGLGGLDGLQPHVQRHMYQCYKYWLVKNKDPGMFARRFVGGIAHWMGQHSVGQCSSTELCPQEGRLLDCSPAIVAALTTTLQRAARQYADWQPGSLSLNHHSPKLQRWRIVMEMQYSLDWSQRGPADAHERESDDGENGDADEE